MAEEKGCCICFSNKTKQKCAMFVLIVSIVLVVLGAFVAIYGYFGLDIEETWVIGDEEFPSPTALFGILAILVGLFTIVTGVLGALTAKCKNACFAIPFAIFSLVLCIAMLVVAALALIGQAAQDDIREQFCQKQSMNVNNKAYNNLEDYMQKMYGETVDKYMCTGVCPCPEGKWVASYNTAVSVGTDGKGKRITPEPHRLYRIPSIADPTCSQTQSIAQLEYNSKDDESQIPLCFKPAGADTHETFKACWNKPTTGLKAQLDATVGNSESVQNINDIIKFIGTIEDSFGDCSGSCALPLFGIVRNVKEGPATKECVEHIIDSLDTLLGPGIVCLLTFFVLLCACCGSCTLCRGFNKDDAFSDGP